MMSPEFKSVPVAPVANASGSAARLAFSLIEVLIAVTLMSVIVLGLLAMFSETQRAFRTGITQVDIMESGRSAMEMIAREMEQVTPTRQSSSANFFAQGNGYAMVQSLPGTAPGNQWRTNVAQDVFFTTRNNQLWFGVSYKVIYDNSSVGTLCRYVVGAEAIDSAAVSSLDNFAFQGRSNRITDGVVHFRVLAYDNHGVLITPYDTNYTVPTGQIIATAQLPSDISFLYTFSSNAVPAYLDVELGIIEQKVAERARGLAYNNALLPSDPNQPQVRYLAKQAGRVQMFHQRIPVRNVDPTVYP